MVSSVGNQTTNPVPNTGSTQGTTASPTGLPKSPFDAVRSTVGNGVAGAGQAAIGLTDATGRSVALNPNQTAVNAGGLTAFIDARMVSLRTANKGLQQEIKTLEADIKNTDPNAQKDGYNDALVDARAKLAQDTLLAKDPNSGVTQDEVKADQKVVDDEVAKLQAKIDADKAAIEDNTAKLNELQNQVSTGFTVVREARDDLASALGEFDPANQLPDNFHDTTKAAVRHAEQNQVILSQQERADRERIVQQAVVAGGQAVAETEQRLLEKERRLRASVDRARQVVAAFEPISVEHLRQHLRETGETLPENVVARRESNRGNGADQADNAEGAGNSAQASVALGGAAGSTSNGFLGESNGAVAAAQGPAHENIFNDGVNPLDDGVDHFDRDFNPLDDKVDHFALHGDPIKHGVVGDLAELRQDGEKLLKELNDLDSLLQQLGVPAGASSRGAPFMAGVDQNRVRIFG